MSTQTTSIQIPMAIGAIIVCMLMMLAGVDSASAGPEHDEYTKEVRERFSNFTLEMSQFLVKLSSRDEVSDTKWVSTMNKLVDIYNSRPREYPPTQFWEVGAESTINTSFLASDNFRLRNRGELYHLVDEVEVMVRQYASIEKRLSENDIRSILIIRVMHTFNTIFDTTGIVNRQNAPKAAVAAFWLVTMETELKKHTTTEIKSITNDPFIKKLTEVMTAVRESNQWPDKQSASGNQSSQ